MLPRWLIGFRALALASAFAAAFVPIATYITDDKRDWLWIHIGVNIAAYIAVALTTIYTTISLTQQDHNKYRVPAYWANNVVMRTWYLGVSRTWRWHVAAAVGRLGLALALAQHVHIVALTGPEVYRMSQFQGILSPFYYISYNILAVDANLRQMFRTRWELALIGLLVLIGFAILETGLLAAFTVMLTKLRKDLGGVLSIGLRLAIIFGIVLFINHLYSVIIADMATSDGYLYYYYSRHRPLFRHWHQVAFSWLDNGTMLSAWIMRPASFVYDIEGDLLNTLIDYATYIIGIVTSLQLAHYLRWRREQGMTRHAPTDTSTV